jgi:hypothetical protein
MDMKRKSNPFKYRYIGNVIEVWYGLPEDAESEFVLSVHESLIPSLIATLKKATK